MDERPFPLPIEMPCTAQPLIGAYFYDELIKCIDDAKISIYSVQYQWKWNVHERHSKIQCLGTAISRAITRNVATHIILNNESPKSHLTKINRVTNDALSRQGAEVRMIRVPGLLHTKLWTFDGHIVFIGSHNISCRSLSINEEVSVKIDSVEMAKFMQTYFDNLWGSR